MLVVFLKVVFLNHTQVEQVLMGDTQFTPNKLAIKKNSRVVFKNDDGKDHWPASDLHPTHEIYPEFDPQKPIKSGASWEFIFEKTGNYSYHDHLSPAIRGSIEVVE